MADDAEILAMLEHAPPAQRRPNLLLAAVHSLLLAGSPHPLAGFYDTVRPAGTPAPEGGVAAAFRDFCLTHQEKLLELIRTRSTQTNEVGRCAILLPAFNAIAARYGDDVPVSLLDLGTSAGLNLLFDRYRYTYHDTDTSLEAGDQASSVNLDCAVRSQIVALPSLRLPKLADRAGLDLSPIDASRAVEARWLLACLWPDNLTRFNRLRAALDLWRMTADRPRLIQGDMVRDLTSVARTIGGDEPLIIFHTWVAAYLTEEEQRALVDIVAALGASRPVHHLYAELPFETPGLPMPPGPEARPRADAATALVHIGPGGATPERWANVHPHGTWLRWFPMP